MTQGVVAVVVGAADSPFLPLTLGALAGQSRPPERVLIGLLPGEEDVDPKALVADAGLTAASAVQMVNLREPHMFGVAVSQTLAASDDEINGWLWLLHDDSAPQADALAEMLVITEKSSSVGIIGAKQLDWDDPDHLISVGVRATFDGQRLRDIDETEIDQGQHDGREDIYAVGTAGMLVDAELWRRLGGPDPALGVFGDGIDLSRRARLAGQRVLIAPKAKVHHARAGYQGLRAKNGSRTRKPVGSDPRRSFRARRTAQVHSWLVRSPLLLSPLVAILALLLGPVRALWRLVRSELSLAGDEVAAPLAALLRPGSIIKARRRAAKTRKISPRRLRPLQATWGEVWRARRNRRMQAATERRAARAPSELEIAERAAVARRRRFGFGVVLLVSLSAALVALAPVVFSGPLIGGALLPIDAPVGEVWEAANNAWIATGDGYAGPPDVFGFVLVLLSTLTGGWFGVPMAITVALTLLLAIPLAAIGAWFAAGAVTRSVWIRAWAAGVWAFGPPLLLAIGDGRLGALIAHLALPLVALGIARAVGVDQRDVIVSGMVGAKRLHGQAADSDEPAESSEKPTTSSQKIESSEVADSLEDAESLEGAEADDAADVADADADADADETKKAEAAEDDATDADPADDEPADEDADADQPTAAAISRMSRAPSLGAAAGAGLAFAVATAGAPVLLPAGLLCLLLLALTAGGRATIRRGRLILVALPALVVLAPVWLSAVQSIDSGAWRLLLADPGAPFGSQAADTWVTALGWPQSPSALDGNVILAILTMAATGAVIVVAVLALLRSGGRGRVARIGWLFASVGLATALVSQRTTVALATNTETGAEEFVSAWAGPGTSLLLLGLLMAATSGAHGLRSALAGKAFGWRQIGASLATAVVIAALVGSAVAWTVAAVQDRGEPRGDMMAFADRGADPVPALGLSVQSSEHNSRVLALNATSWGVDGQVWRDNGPQLTQTSTVGAIGQALRKLNDEAPDAADEHLMSVVADLSAGPGQDVAARLGQHAISVVIVPPAESTTTFGTDATARGRLIAQLDTVPGLERVTENSSGVIWRVSTGSSAGDATLASVHITDGSGQVLAIVPPNPASGAVYVNDQGEGRTIVMSERRASAWRAELGGQALRSVSDSWRQEFIIPDGASGELTITYQPYQHRPWQIASAVVLVLTGLLALPARRRRAEEEAR